MMVVWLGGGGGGVVGLGGGMHPPALAVWAAGAELPCRGVRAEPPLPPSHPTPKQSYDANAAGTHYGRLREQFAALGRLIGVHPTLRAGSRWPREGGGGRAGGQQRQPAGAAPPLAALEQRSLLIPPPPPHPPTHPPPPRFVLVPGPGDVGPASSLPRPALAAALAGELLAAVPGAALATNPCRIRHGSAQLVLFRDDLQVGSRAWCGGVG